MNIYKKLVEVRRTVPYLKKDNKGHQFQYVSSSQTLGVLREKMDELELLLKPAVINKTVSDHKTKNGGHEYFTELEMEFTWINAEKPEETVTCPWYGQGLDSGEKGTGKALTYAEKYFLLKFFNIATDKDDPDSFQKKVDSSKPKDAQREKYNKTIAWLNSFSDIDSLNKGWAKLGEKFNEFDKKQQDTLNTIYASHAKKFTEETLVQGQ